MSEPQKTLTPSPKTAVIIGLVTAESDRLQGDHWDYRLVQLILCTNLKPVDKGFNHVQDDAEDEGAIIMRCGKFHFGHMGLETPQNL